MFIGIRWGTLMRLIKYKSAGFFVKFFKKISKGGLCVVHMNVRKQNRN